MNEQFRNAPEDIKTNVVMPKQADFKVVAISDPVFANDNIDRKYEKLISNHVDFLNKQSQVLERDKNSLALEMQELMKKREPISYYGKDRVFQLFHSSNGQRRQKTLEMFQDFHTHDSFFAFDIETFGDSQDRIKAYGVSEISLNKYNGAGELIEKGYNGMIRQDQDVVNQLNETLSKLERDKYYYNSMPEWEKRSIVDLMRYSSYTSKDDKFGFSLDNGIQHHSIIDSVFDYKDRVDHDKVVRNMDYYLNYMRSGLNTIANTGDTKEDAMRKTIEIMQGNRDKYFVSYNGNNFDVPVLSAFAQKNGGTPLPEIKHLDYLNLIRTVFNDSDDLKRMVDSNYQGSDYGKDKLASFRNILPEDNQSDAHNATVDTNDTAKVAAITKDHIAEAIEKNHRDIVDGFQLHPSQNTWNKDPLKNGQTLFANGGTMAFREGDESFRVRLDENGKWVQESNGYNKTVLNSRTFYQFAGGQSLEDGKLAFRFYDPERNEYSYIVRSGNPKTGATAFEELQDFVQSRFYNWENAPEELRQQIHHVAETDRARRRYDRYFSMDGAGKGLTVVDGEVVERGTKGFSGLKRMLYNAQIMKDFEESKGQTYRDAVERLRAEGLSEMQAKEQARKVRQNELIKSMQFDSLWDPDARRYVFNEREKDSFFKIYGRLKDEMPYLNRAVSTIDESFADEIKDAATIVDGEKRRQRLKEINQKRDMSLMNYWQGVERQVGMPTAQRDLQEFEGHRLSYFDPETNNTRSINFETVESARNNIYGYARRGVEEDNPNRNRVIKERANNLLENLFSQNKINENQRSMYQDILFRADSPYEAINEIVISMRQLNGGKYDTSIEEPSIIGNKNIKNLEPIINRNLIEQAIIDTQNAQMVINMNAIDGKKLVLGEEMRKTLQILDQDRFSRLTSNNYKALETLVTRMREADPSSQISIAMDTTNKDGNVKIYSYDRRNSVSVQNQLARGVSPTQALEVNLPLINQSGTHKVGAMVVNAHSVAVREDGGIKMISSSEQIARGLADDMHRISKIRKEGNYEQATKEANRSLRRQIQNMSGIQRNMELGPNDTYKWANNESDALKQSHIKVGNAMIEDMYYNGYGNIQLKESDFYDPEDVFLNDTDENGKRKLRRGVELSDIKMDTQYSMLMNMTDWAEENLKVPVFTNSLKAEQVAKGIVSLEDMRQRQAYGSYFSPTRDNLIQYRNAYLINDSTENNLKETPGVNRNPLLRTERQREYENLYGNQTGINMRTAYMTNDELRSRIHEMYGSDEGRKLLGEIGLLTEDGKLNHIALPRLYEQQGIIAKDVVDSLSVDNEKRYETGNQFEINSNLSKNSIVNPGETLGTRIHDNGYREKIRYEGNSPAVLKSGTEAGEDILLQWQSDPFKIMLDGEKMTDSPVDRRFIQAVTGRDDIVAILNPDVEKHKDFGMLMAGEARLLADEINQMSSSKRKEALQVIGEYGEQVGLQWDNNSKGFIDTSFNTENNLGKPIDRNAFDTLFSELNEKGINVSPITETGLRYGILEAHLSKVSNYSKIVDASGHRVINYDQETGKKIYASGFDGVQWGHREMGVLKSQGLEKTYEHAYQIMMENQNPERINKDISRLQEAQAISQSLEYMTQDERANIEAISAGRFESLPEEYRNELTYKGTVFDRDKVSNLIEQYGYQNAMEDKGFWMELPSVKRSDGQLDKITVEGKEINKIFIPFTNREGANGETHLRTLQQRIARIYEKADEINKATSLDDARKAQGQLQTAVNRYVEQSFQELSSSKGMLFGDVFKTPMGSSVNDVNTSSASGLFKLMDYETSLQYGDGEYTVISEDMARKMGVYDQLDEGKDLYTANVRYPTFHDGAMQFTKLRMDPSVKPGEIHTTSFSSMLQNADSDGDYSHIVVMDDEQIQQEWKQAHDRTKERFFDQWEKHYNDSLEESKPVSIARTSPDLVVPNAPGSSDEEMAAKIGKMTIGRASNLNLYMRQVADRFYQDDSEMNYKIKRFGQGLEQRLIDAKHGAEPVGLKMIDSIYSGNWDKAMELDKEYFEGKFQKDFYMNDVSQEMPIALQRVRNGLHTDGFKFGTSTGIDPKHGIQSFIDMLNGRGDLKDYGGNNHALEMYLKFLGEDPLTDTGKIEPIPRLTNTPMKDRMDNTKGLMGHARNVATDAIGGGISNVGGKVKQSFESIKGLDGTKKALIGTALAVAGISGYNILNTEKPEMHYNNQESMPMEEPVPAIQTGTEPYPSRQNASIEISASGGKMNQDELSHAVTQGMQHAGMSSGPTRMSVSYQDNTRQLNQQWYRDVVQENI